MSLAYPCSGVLRPIYAACNIVKPQNVRNVSRIMEYDGIKWIGSSILIISFHDQDGLEIWPLAAKLVIALLHWYGEGKPRNRRLTPAVSPRATCITAGSRIVCLLAASAFDADPCVALDCSSCWIETCNRSSMLPRFDRWSRQWQARCHLFPSLPQWWNDPLKMMLQETCPASCPGLW